MEGLKDFKDMLARLNVATNVGVWHWYVPKTNHHV